VRTRTIQRGSQFSSDRCSRTIQTARGETEPWKEVGEVHGEFFDQIRPALTMVEIARLIDDAAMIEIEADAIVHSEHKEHI